MKERRIALYARGLSEKEGGVRRYIESLLTSMAQDHNTTGPMKNYALYVIHNQKNTSFCRQNAAIHDIFMRSKNKVICDYLLTPYLIHRFKIDLAFYPKNVIPYLSAARNIVTIHDLAYFYPEYRAYPLLDTVYMKRMIRRSCRKADKIIAVSENTRKDIIHFLGVEEKKIRVVYEGVSSAFRRIEDKALLIKMKEKYHLNNKFILFTGGISPRKNLLRLFAAFSSIQDHIPHDLVITGGKGWHNSRELKMIHHNHRIKWLGHVPEDDLTSLYNLADVYVYPSLYEGFGLPVLEAQACGCPVIASNTSSLPEVGGDSVAYIDPFDVSDIARKIEYLVTHDDEKRRYIQMGLANVGRFSWERAACELVEIIESILDEDEN